MLRTLNTKPDCGSIQCVNIYFQVLLISFIKKMSKISFSFFAYFCLKNMNKISIKMKIDSINSLLFTTILLYQVNV